MFRELPVDIDIGSIVGMTDNRHQYLVQDVILQEVCNLIEYPVRRSWQFRRLIRKSNLHADVHPSWGLVDDQLPT